MSKTRKCPPPPLPNKKKYQNSIHTSTIIRPVIIVGALAKKATRRIRTVDAWIRIARPWRTAINCCHSCAATIVVRPEVITPALAQVAARRIGRIYTRKMRTRTCGAQIVRDRCCTTAVVWSEVICTTLAQIAAWTVRAVYTGHVAAWTLWAEVMDRDCGGSGASVLWPEVVIRALAKIPGGWVGTLNAWECSAWSRRAIRVCCYRCN